MLLKWFEENRREYPWRKTHDPYRVLIAELMLQRTKADQVRGVYLKFLEEFPDIYSIYKAPEDRIEKYFSQLGLKWRTSKVKELARVLVEKYNGNIPCSKEDLLSLPGIGDYISSAVLSFACGIPVPVVDANVVRVITRYFGIKPKGEGRRDPEVHHMAYRLLPPERHREFNWAILDFGAKVCLPRKPLCQNCPLAKYCVYQNQKNLECFDFYFSSGVHE